MKKYLSVMVVAFLLAGCAGNVNRACRVATAGNPMSDGAISIPLVVGCLVAVVIEEKVNP